MPFETEQKAKDDRAHNAWKVLDSIPNKRTVPLFREFISGGGPLRDISGVFAADFTKAAETVQTTKLLVKALEDSIRATPPHFPPGLTTVRHQIGEHLTVGEIDHIMKTMAFHDYQEPPALLAGGIGTNPLQSSCKVGHQTSDLDDARLADGHVTITKNDDGTLQISPEITFTVKDTLDFCPGACGSGPATKLTVPMSRWEASGISGDVPFTVRFPAPSLTGAFDDDLD
jgi:hypothetical protein